MRFKATHVALTSLFNRGVIVDLLGREISRSRRQPVPTAILLCTLRTSTTPMAISLVTKYYRKPPGACSYRCALTITSGVTVVKSS
jgi:hypothetical protein